MSDRWTRIGVLLILAAVFLVPYSTTSRLRNDNVHACNVRAKPRDRAAAKSWRRSARAAGAISRDPFQSQRTRRIRRGEARLHSRTARTLTRLANQPCEKVYPKPPLFPF